MFSLLRREAETTTNKRHATVYAWSARILPIAGAALVATLSGCGSASTKPSAQIRAVNVSTNTVDVTNHNDYGFLLVNTAAASGTLPYGTPTEYQYVEAGTSGFSGGFPNGLPTIATQSGNATLTLPKTTSSTSTTQIIVPPAVNKVNLVDGKQYTAYLCGRPDVASPTQADLSDLDSRYYKAVVLEDNQPTPPAGATTVRALLAAADSGNVDILVNGSVVPAFQNISYAPAASQPSTNDATLPSGVVSVQVNKAGTATVLVPATPLTLTAGKAYTIVVDEPTALPTPAVNGSAPDSATYALALIKD